MALQGTTVKRTFKYNGLTLADPSSEKSADKVREFYSKQYPELLTAIVEGPVTKNGNSVYTFVRAAGEKG